MGIIGVDKANHLYWLGRYTERVFTTLGAFFKYYDGMIEKNEESYREFCSRLSIPDIYGSKEDFVQAYLFDKNNPDSIYSNLMRAYDNAVVMRNDISTESLAYIQMALDLFEKSRGSVAPLVVLQPVIDTLFAFWGSIDDFVDNEESRNIMKCGKYIERIDLYIRLSIGEKDLKKEFHKLKNRLEKVKLSYSKSSFASFERMLEGEDYKVRNIERGIFLLESII